MKRNAQYFLLTALIAAAAGLLPEPFAPVFAQPIAPDATAGAPHDWSHRHLVYSNVDTRDEVTRKGYRAFEEWQNKHKDPRFARAVARKEQFIQAARKRDNAPQQIWTSTPFSQLPQNHWTNKHRNDPLLVEDPPPVETAIHRDWSVSLGAGIGKQGVFPAKFGFDVNAVPSCGNDFVVYTTAAAGSGTQPTIVAFNNLYKGTCGTTVGTNLATTFWSYNTTSGGGGSFTETSPVLSLDGSQVAFIQRTGSGGSPAQLVLLKWKSGTGSVGAPVVPRTETSAANYRNNANNCALANQPCMLVIALTGGSTVTNSSPFVDYLGDNLYVGDDAGRLHKFTGVFNGLPAEQITGGFPATALSGRILSSPVFDYASGNVFIGSASSGAGSQSNRAGRLHAVNATTGAVVSSAELAPRSTNFGVKDSPIVDSSAQKVYAFVGTDTGTNDSAYCQPSPCMAVHQFDTGFAAGSSGIKQQVGNADATSKLYAGSFDEAYYTTGSGYLYVCGSISNASKRPTAWRIQITDNAMVGATEGFRMSNANSDCSPVTMLANGANEYAYLSVTAGGIMSGCSGACLYMWDLNHLPEVLFNTAGTTSNAAIAAPGGTSGIIMDNVSLAPGASQIYYSTLASPGNAIQASQSGLQ